MSAAHPVTVVMSIRKIMGYVVPGVIVGIPLVALAILNYIYCENPFRAELRPGTAWTIVTILDVLLSILAGALLVIGLFAAVIAGVTAAFEWSHKARSESR